MGESAIPTSHPLNVGMVGMHGNYGPNVLTNECDVLIAIGMRFDDRVTGKFRPSRNQQKCQCRYRRFRKFKGNFSTFIALA